MYRNGFFVMNKTWFGQNGFFTSLSHAEFRIILYLLASVLRLDKRRNIAPQAMFLAGLYRDKKLLVANVAQRTIAKKCNVNRGTVQSALRKFEALGAVIVLPCENQGIQNNLYCVG